MRAYFSLIFFLVHLLNTHSLYVNVRRLMLHTISPVSFFVVVVWCLMLKYRIRHQTQYLNINVLRKPMWCTYVYHIVFSFAHFFFSIFLSLYRIHVWLLLLFKSDRIRWKKRRKYFTVIQRLRHQCAQHHDEMASFSFSICFFVAYVVLEPSYMNWISDTSRIHFF